MEIVSHGNNTCFLSKLIFLNLFPLLALILTSEKFYIEFDSIVTHEWGK